MTVSGMPKPKAVQVADVLREEIKNMAPGDRIPPQSKLVERFGFAGQTVQNGLSILREEGLIVSVGNLGNFVSDGAPVKRDVRGELEELHSRIQELRARVEDLEKRLASRGNDL